MGMHKNIFAQGTIEYLVILAIVVIVGLIVVGYATSFIDPAGEVNKNISLAHGLTSSTIIITDTAFDDGNGYIGLKNLDSESLTITSISSGTQENNFNTPLFGNDEKFFQIDDFPDCPCDGTVGTKTCTFTLTATTVNGLTKKAVITTSVNCETEVTPPTNVITELTCKPTGIDSVSCASVPDDVCTQVTGCTLGGSQYACNGTQYLYGSCSGLSEEECSADNYCEWTSSCVAKDCGDFSIYICPYDNGCEMVGTDVESCVGTFNCPTITTQTLCNSVTEGCSWN